MVGRESIVDDGRWTMDERRRSVMESEGVKERERAEEREVELCSFYSERGYLLFRDASRLRLLRHLLFAIEFSPSSFSAYYISFFSFEY